MTGSGKGERWRSRATRRVRREQDARLGATDQYLDAEMACFVWESYLTTYVVDLGAAFVLHANLCRLPNVCTLMETSTDLKAYPEDIVPHLPSLPALTVKSRLNFCILGHIAAQRLVLISLEIPTRQLLLLDAM